MTGVNGGVVSTHSDVEDGDYVEGRGEDGAHALDGRLIQAVVGRKHLPVRDKQPPEKDKQTTLCMPHYRQPHWDCRCAFMCCATYQTHNSAIQRLGKRTNRHFMNQLCISCKNSCSVIISTATCLKSGSANCSIYFP